MKKAFFTLCFLVSASFAMANNIENKQETPAQKTEVVVLEEKPNGSCTHTLLDENFQPEFTVTIVCTCTDFQACQAAEAAVQSYITNRG